MNEFDSKMTALADEIRELSGSNTAKSLDDMTTDVDAANAEIVEQTELLEQIATALEGKASGGGSSASMQTCTVTISDNLNCGIARIICTVLDSNGEINGICCHSVDLPQTINNIICGSAVYVENVSRLIPYEIISDDCTQIDCNGAYGIAFRAPITNGAISSVTIMNNY